MRRLLITIVLVGALVGGLVLGGPRLKDWLNSSIAGVLDPPQCTVTLAGGTYSLDPDQTANAALMGAIATQRGMPARAVTIAIATSMQETKLRNLSVAVDHDSLGLFQQRPSQGWGTAEQVSNAQYAINAFYDMLVKVVDWDKSFSSEIDQASWIGRVAQKVQRSADEGGESYASHVPYARAFASALTGQGPHSLNCTIPAPTSSEIASASKEVSGFYRAYVGTPITRGTTTTFPVKGSDAGGWAAAEYLVAHAERFGALQVSYDGWTWAPDKGWKQTSGGSAGIVAVFA